VLQAPLHHDPTPGGPEAQIIYRRQYAQTLALIRTVHGAGAEPELLDRRRLRQECGLGLPAWAGAVVFIR